MIKVGDKVKIIRRTEEETHLYYGSIGKVIKISSVGPHGANRYVIEPIKLFECCEQVEFVKGWWFSVVAFPEYEHNVLEVL